MSMCKRARRFLALTVRYAPVIAILFELLALIL